MSGPCRDVYFLPTDAPAAPAAPAPQSPPYPTKGAAPNPICAP